MPNMYVLLAYIPSKGILYQKMYTISKYTAKIYTALTQMGQNLQFLGQFIKNSSNHSQVAN